MVDFSISGKILSTFLDLMIAKNTKMDWYKTLYLYYGQNVTFNFAYVLTWLNDYFSLHLELFNRVCF